MSKIYFKDADTSSVENLIKSLYTIPLFKGSPTLKAQATYEDKEFKTLQCHPARRSITDLTNIVRTYFKDADMHTVLQECLKVENFLIHYCADIEKYVSVIVGMHERLKEFIIVKKSRALDRVGTDGLSLKDIVQLGLGCNREEAIKILNKEL